MNEGKVMSRKISVVVVKGTVCYVAIGLEHYITAQGETPKEAMFNFVKTLAADLAFCDAHGLKPLEGVEKAPKKYWDMYNKALGIKDEFVPSYGSIKSTSTENSLAARFARLLALPSPQKFPKAIDYRVMA